VSSVPLASFPLLCLGNVRGSLPSAGAGQLAEEREDFHGSHSCENDVPVKWDSLPEN
jgi:hypothetical protein